MNCDGDVDDLLPLLSVRLQLGESPFDPADISTRVGLEPTHSRRLGDLVHPDFGARMRADTWELRVGPREEWDLNALLDELRAKLETSWDRLVAECAAGDLAPCVACVVELRSTQTPAINLPPQNLSWLHAIDATLDVEIVARGLRRRTEATLLV